ncbi:serine hydrolase domain-containing protein [Streptomyces sp. NPDC048603]|uniref:serine hydrolase domain-containing protein n=1 Tax=Streptomyces sp. NPDC048603 TaxID=3365577 RepID=UPI00372108B7
MNARRRTLIAAALVVGLAAGPVAASGAVAAGRTPTAVAAAPAPVFTSPPNAAALERAIAGLGADHPHATAALVRVSGTAGSWQGSSGVADIRTGRPAMEQGRFRAGSVTKTFTAAVVLQLAAEGRVDPNRPVRDYLPDHIPAAYAQVTVRQLLNYTSGLPVADGPGDSFQSQWEHRFDVVDPRAQIANAVAKEREFAPGEAQHYSNINYTVLGVLIEKLTGTTYERAVEQRIAKPLGLRHTWVPGRTEVRIHGPHNRGYQAVARPDGSVERRDVTVWNQSDRWAAGGLISTTEDLERFTQELFAGRVVPRPQLEEMFTVPQVRDISGKEATRSAGLELKRLPDGTEVWGKGGGRPGYNTGIGGVRDGSRVVVYSVNSLDAKAITPSPVATAVVMAALAPQEPGRSPLPGA